MRTYERKRALATIESLSKKTNETDVFPPQIRTQKRTHIPRIRHRKIRFARDTCNVDKKSVKTSEKTAMERENKKLPCPFLY